MSLAPWLDAFVPVFGLLALGALLRRTLLQQDAVWAGIEKLVFWVLLPCLIAGALAGTRFAELPVGGMALAIWAALAAGTVAAFTLSRALGHDHATATSVLQGGIRYNNLVGFALAGTLWGAPGLALAALSTALIVPCVQLILAFAFAMDGRRLQPSAVARQILLNPLVVACAAGGALSVAGGLPPGLKPLVGALGGASVALGLLSVGAALTLRGLAERPGTQAATAVLKLTVVPAVTWAVCAAAGVGPVATGVAVLFMALPTASTSYVMARAMGGNAPLMAAITSNQHLVAAASLPVWAWLLAGG